MSLKRNTIANYIGQGYTALVGIVVMPLYLKYLGAEAFGLVGFFVLLQAWLNLLDFGLSPTLARQVAVARGLRNGLKDFGKLLRSFETIFLLVATTIGVSVFLSSSWIADEWIDSRSIPKETIAFCVALMGVSGGLRLFASLYRSGLTGAEDQVWLNIANIAIVSMRFIGAFLLMRFVSTEVRIFFEYQVIIGVAEIIVLAARFYKNLAINPVHLALGIHWPSMRAIAPFASGIAYSAAIWITITQVDKIILSGVLPLDEFGYFSIVSLIAGGIMVATAPIAQAIMPRMTNLLVQGEKNKALQIYRNASQLVTVIAFSIALITGFFADALIYAWTGDGVAAEWGGDVLLWFALGNGVLALSAFQYYLQNSFGQLRLHVVGSTISAICQVPIIYYAATRYGAVGAGIAWFGIRVVWLMGWMPIVHRTLVPGLHFNWFVKDVLPVVLVSAVSIAVLNGLVRIDLATGRMAIIGYLILLGSTQLLVAAISSNFIRSRISQYVYRERRVFKI